ncbi:MAG: hypothetical protein IJ496_02505 [Ruminococcus sp.]|nr:hypothetical protein [Ruminococcus sp.]
MLLTETIGKSISAIQHKRDAQEQRQSDEAYGNALAQLNKASQELKNILECAAAMKEKGIVDHPVMAAQLRDELLECVNNCGRGVSDGALTADMVRVLKAKGDAAAVQIKIVWKEASAAYAEGTKGYLLMIGGLSDDPGQAGALADNITRTVAGEPSVRAVKSLAADVAAAKKITEAFSLNPEIESFLKKVSVQQATAADLTPGILTWLQEKRLTSKLKIRF